MAYENEMINWQIMKYCYSEQERYFSQKACQSGISGEGWLKSKTRYPGR